MNDSMLKVGGKPFYCSCGANVFHKGNKPGLWVCNGCGTEYADETYDSRKTNADRIRRMSDEELVVFLDGFTCNCIDCRDNDGRNEICPIYKRQYGRYCEPKDIMGWLQSPAEEDT